VTGIALLSLRTLVPQQPIEWNIAVALSLKVEAKMHNVTFANHLFFAFEALCRPYGWSRRALPAAPDETGLKVKLLVTGR
jgi:hypothetical protein